MHKVKIVLPQPDSMEQHMGPRSPERPWWQTLAISQCWGGATSTMHVQPQSRATRAATTRVQHESKASQAEREPGLQGLPPHPSWLCPQESLGWLGTPQIGWLLSAQRTLCQQQHAVCKDWECIG